MAGVLPSPPADDAASKATDGASSSSVMVRVCETFPPRAALPGLLRVTCTVSGISSVLSLMMVTVIVSVVTPAARVRVPGTRV